METNNTINQTKRFKKWHDNMKDVVGYAKVKMEMRKLKNGNYGNSKSLGGGLVEIKINYGPGYRIYYTKTGKNIYLLLIGGDKSTQSKDIATARKLIK